MINISDTAAALAHLEGIDPEAYPGLLVPDTDPILSRRCWVALDGPDGALTDFSRKFSRVLAQRLKDYGGLGLAAPQIGIPLSIIAIRLGKSIRVINNPVLNNKSVDKKFGDEGCLSYPNRKLKVRRYRWVHLTGSEFDEMGQLKSFNETLYGLDAVVAQHEVDHINGITLFNGELKQ